MLPHLGTNHWVNISLEYLYLDVYCILFVRMRPETTFEWVSNFSNGLEPYHDPFLYISYFYSNKSTFLGIIALKLIETSSINLQQIYFLHSRTTYHKQKIGIDIIHWSYSDFCIQFYIIYTVFFCVDVDFRVVDPIVPNHTSTTMEAALPEFGSPLCLIVVLVDCSCSDRCVLVFS